jgi:peptidoglycan hydrolase CwlO-like protein
MPKLLTVSLSFIFTFVLLLVLNTVSILADTDLDQKKKEIVELEAKLVEIQGQKQTLSKTIEYLNTKIQLAQKQIANTEAEIVVLEEEVGALSGKINILDSNLGKLSALLVNRVNFTYRKATAAQPVYLLLTSNGFSDFLKRYKYLKVGQKHDRAVMFDLEKARANFDEQKHSKELKQQELEKAKKKLLTQKITLDQQQKEKQALLQITRNDEREYQQMVAKAKAELEAIQSVVAGKGSETEVKKVNEGDSIASIIVGKSVCSSGTHLHFEASKDSLRINPFSVLKSISLIWDNNDSQANGSGSWNWPINEPIRITQSYGNTSYSSIYAGNFHTGVDMVNSDNMTVKAAKSGTLFRGAIGCGSGTLRYVHVKQDDGYDTFYLHVNY